MSSIARLIGSIIFVLSLSAEADNQSVENKRARYEFAGHFYGNASSGSLISSYLFADLSLTRISADHLTKLRFSTIQSSSSTFVTINGEDPTSPSGLATLSENPRLFSSIEGIQGNRLSSISHQYLPDNKISPVIYIRKSENPQINLTRNNVAIAEFTFRLSQIVLDSVEDGLSVRLGVGYFDNNQNDQEEDGSLVSAGLNYTARFWRTSILVDYAMERSSNYQRAETRLGIDFWFHESVAISIHNRTLRFNKGVSFPDQFSGKSDSNSSLGIIFRKNY